MAGYLSSTGSSPRLQGALRCSARDELFGYAPALIDIVSPIVPTLVTTAI